MRERKVAWILLRGASVQSLSDGVLTLNFVREGDAKGFAGGGHDRVLAGVLQEMLGTSPQIRTVVGAPDDAASAGAAPPGPARTSGGSAAGSDWDLPPGGGAGPGRARSGPSTRDLRRMDPVGRPMVPSRAVRSRAVRSRAVRGGAVRSRAVRGGAVRSRAGTSMRTP